ncbi:MAG: patatin-like phospholipase family protein [Burkholderiaceae bacterium]|nr:patatin-like phospholipase family protein [Burkholderiaceae bacterium]
MLLRLSRFASALLLFFSLFAQAEPREFGAPAAAPPSATPLAAGAHRPRICLVLSGGGARGAAHVGVIQVLEEMRVPIDCIAGTSMGAIVGAAYASGMSVHEMMRELDKLTLERLFSDKPPRALEPMSVKADDFVPLASFEFGLSKQGLATPKGLISGVALEAELRHLVKVRGVHRFDDLPIPYRAVATNLGNGTIFVFDHGELTTAMRASMAVPAIVAPLNLDGTLLVDGGLVRNLPVDIARAMGADIVIAVNLGTPLLKPDQIKGMMGVSMQMINILAEENVRESLGQLRPQDVLILPELGSFSAADFDHLALAVPFGEAAARKVADRLAPLALPPREYAALRARQQSHAAPLSGTIDAIEIVGNERVNPAVFLDDMETKPGEPLDEAKLDLDMRRIYGTGDFESVQPEIDSVGGRQTLKVSVTEKSWGPTYARFGISLEAALGQNATFDLFGKVRTTWLNQLGAEWRNDFILGNTVYLGTSWYQPLTPAQDFFVEPRASYLNTPFDIYVGDVKYAEYNDQLLGAGLDAGANLREYGEARVGLFFGERKFKLTAGPTLFPSTERTTIGAVRVGLRLDRLDNVSLPRSGYFLDFEAVDSLPALGATDSYVRYFAEARAAFSSGHHTLRLSVRAGGTPDEDDLPAYAQFRLGGFLNMSGYRPQQLMGPRFVYGRAIYQYKLRDIPLFQGAYAGVSYELADMPQIIESNDKSLFQSGTLFLAVDTPLGVAYLGYGYASGGNQAIYLFLGKPY